MSQLEFVNINLEDTEHCNKLLILLNAYMEDEMGMGESMPENLGSSIIQGLKKHSGYRGFFALHGSHYAGLVNCNMNYSTFAAKPLLNIHDVIVLPTFRKLGVGEFLLNRIAEYATQQGCSKITLEVREDNTKAKNLYRKVGFLAGEPPYGFWEKEI